MRNGRQSLLLSERAGWHAALVDTALDLSRGAITLRRIPASIRSLADTAGSFGGLADPTGVAIDAAGRVYVLDTATCEIRRYDPCTEAFETLRCIGGEGSAPRQFRAPRGLAISLEGDLIVADTGNARVQIFLLDGLVLRKILRPPLPGWEPWDVAATRDCRLLVSDHAHGVVHCFDRRGRRLDSIDGFHKPTGIALDCHERLYVLQEGRTDVVVVEKDGPRTVTRIDEIDADAFSPRSFELDAEGNISPAPETPPAFDTEGAFVAGPLDSRLYACQWHRAVLRGSISPGTQVRVETFTSESPKTADEIAALTPARWMTRQDHVRVGEGAWDCLILSPPGRYCWIRLTLTGSGGAAARIDSVRVHFPRASSLQYLPAVFSEEPASRDFLSRFLSIFDSMREGISEQVGNAARYFDPDATPAEPPARGANDFLTWLGSWIGLALERNWPVAKRRRLLREAHRLYELRGTPEGLRMHLQLFADREPRLLEHFKLRRWMFLDGGRLGDCAALFGSSIVRRLQLDRFSRIGEFQLVDSGDPLRDPFHAHAHRFTVTVPLRDGADEADERRILERIIEMAKPAHTLAELQLIRPRLRIGVQSFIGVDTVVAQYPAETVTGEGRLGRDTVLSPPKDEAKPPAMRVGTRTRIGDSTTLR